MKLLLLILIGAVVYYGVETHRKSMAKDGDTVTWVEAAKDIVGL